ncbi:MAG: hypothetical protein KDA52_07735 [Planctomycetaceae bacterium]|nr:hypothetical protein [Planctomycetaceae bacterium]
MVPNYHEICKRPGPLERPDGSMTRQPGTYGEQLERLCEPAPKPLDFEHCERLKATFKKRRQFSLDIISILDAYRNGGVG